MSLMMAMIMYFSNLCASLARTDMDEDLDKFIPEDAKEYAQYGWKVARKYLIKV